VVLLTAEPAWVYKQMLKGDRSFDKLQFFVDRYIHDKDGCTGHPFKLAATITGDLHHYARYQKQDDAGGHQYITAGGGGAFLHLTHNLPECLQALNEGHVHQQRVFPDRKTSRRLLLWNFAFPFKNPLFTTMLLGIYFVFYILLHNARPEFFTGLAQDCHGLWDCWKSAGKMLLQSPGILVLCAAIAAGFYAFSDTKVARRGTRLVGVLHGLGQVKLLLLAMFWVGTWAFSGDTLWWQKLYIIPLVCAIAAGCASTLFGIYLYFSNRCCDMHITESSSSLACEDYKNFLRLHIHKDGLSIYPIGIRRVPRHWTTKQSEEKPDEIRFEGDEAPQPFLIEAPIHIHNDKL
jgi:hypothetical protein